MFLDMQKNIPTFGIIYFVDSKKNNTEIGWLVAATWLVGNFKNFF